MGIDRSRRITFEEKADIYNEVRPAYPEELVTDTLDLSGIPAGGRILEIGCGPGNATVQFAARGYAMLCIELGEKLATHARRNCRSFPQVTILNLAFEAWPVQEKAFDLAIAADALHWIPPEIAYPKVAQALKPGGSAAFFWNVPIDPNTDWSRAIDEVYATRASDVPNPHYGFDLPWLTGIIKENFRNSGRFGDVTVRSYTFSERLTAEVYLKRLQTYSSHRGMDEKVKKQLYEGIRAVFDQHGDDLHMPRCVALFVARVRP